MLKVVIVDDERLARENLRMLLHSFCEAIEVVGEASHVDEAVTVITACKPHLVFLDIEMPEKNGFQLLQGFDRIDFQIIFVTAYDRYAIKAFQVSALDYLLKPVEIDLLRQAVDKAKDYFDAKAQSEKLRLLKANKKVLTKIGVPYQKDFQILEIADIECIEADRMYSLLHTKHGKTHVSAKKLQYYEHLLSENMFIRVHRSWLVNLKAIQLYSKTQKSITLDSQKQLPISRSFKAAFEAHFKL